MNSLFTSLFLHVSILSIMRVKFAAVLSCLYFLDASSSPNSEVSEPGCSVNFSILITFQQKGQHSLLCILDLKYVLEQVFDLPTALEYIEEHVYTVRLKFLSVELAWAQNQSVVFFSSEKV